MQLNKLSFSDTHSFSNFFLDYILQKDTLKPFYNHFPKVENFKPQLAEKSSSFPISYRKTLVDTLLKQYKNCEVSESVKKSISSLSSARTFTITTGHQLNIFTGPLYFIYKIVTVINTCKELKKSYPEYDFVPVYWMASEDHDYEEIKYFRLYGQKYVWQTDQKGAVGRFHPKTIEGLLKEVPGDTKVFKDAYLKNNSLSEAVRHYVNALFSSEGLVVLDADDRNLKMNFSSVIKDDLFDHSAKQQVDSSTTQLEVLGYHPQVHAREINFFYLENGLRSRLEKKGDEFIVVDTPLRFSKDQVVKMINEEPEKFSPNVILRPLYQETILPNLAYVGGPAEVIYWLQFKSMFDHFKVPFPLLMPRNFAMVMDGPSVRKFEKTKLKLADLFKEKSSLCTEWVHQNTSNDLSLESEKATLARTFTELRKRAVEIDSTLEKLVDAESKKTLNSLEKIERKLFKAEKRLHSDKLGQIEALKDSLFPGGSPQERIDNFLNFYQQDPQFIQKLIDSFNPFDFRFNVLSYND
jgi:bacillithiol synthase